MSQPAEAKGEVFLGKGSRERHAEHVKAQVQVIRMRAQNQYAQDEGKMLADLAQKDKRKELLSEAHAAKQRYMEAYTSAMRDNNGDNSSLHKIDNELRKEEKAITDAINSEKEASTKSILEEARKATIDGMGQITYQSRDACLWEQATIITQQQAQHMFAERQLEAKYKKAIHPVERALACKLGKGSDASTSDTFVTVVPTRFSQAAERTPRPSVLTPGTSSNENNEQQQMRLSGCTSSPRRVASPSAQKPQQQQQQQRNWGKPDSLTPSWAPLNNNAPGASPGRPHAPVSLFGLGGGQQQHDPALNQWWGPEGYKGNGVPPQSNPAGNSKSPLFVACYPGGVNSSVSTPRGGWSVHTIPPGTPMGGQQQQQQQAKASLSRSTPGTSSSQTCASTTTPLRHSTTAVPQVQSAQNGKFSPSHSAGGQKTFTLVADVGFTSNAGAGSSMGGSGLEGKLFADDTSKSSTEMGLNHFEEFVALAGFDQIGRRLAGISSPQGGDLSATPEGPRVKVGDSSGVDDSMMSEVGCDTPSRAEHQAEDAAKPSSMNLSSNIETTLKDMEGRDAEKPEVKMTGSPAVVKMSPRRYPLANIDPNNAVLPSQSIPVKAEGKKGEVHQQPSSLVSPRKPVTPAPPLLAPPAPQLVTSMSSVSSGSAGPSQPQASVGGGIMQTADARFASSPRAGAMVRGYSGGGSGAGGFTPRDGVISQAAVVPATFGFIPLDMVNAQNQCFAAPSLQGGMGNGMQHNQASASSQQFRRSSSSSSSSSSNGQVGHMQSGIAGGEMPLPQYSSDTVQVPHQAQVQNNHPSMFGGQCAADMVANLPQQDGGLFVDQPMYHSPYPQQPPIHKEQMQQMQQQQKPSSPYQTIQKCNGAQQAPIQVIDLQHFSPAPKAMQQAARKAPTSPFHQQAPNHQSPYRHQPSNSPYRHQAPNSPYCPPQDVPAHMSPHSQKTPSHPHAVNRPQPPQCPNAVISPRPFAQPPAHVITPRVPGPYIPAPGPSQQQMWHQQQHHQSPRPQQQQQQAYQTPRSPLDFVTPRVTPGYTPQAAGNFTQQQHGQAGTPPFNGRSPMLSQSCSGRSPMISSSDVRSPMLSQSTSGRSPMMMPAFNAHSPMISSSGGRSPMLPQSSSGRSPMLSSSNGRSPMHMSSNGRSPMISSSNGRSPMAPMPPVQLQAYTPRQDGFLSARRGSPHQHHQQQQQQYYQQQQQPRQGLVPLAAFSARPQQSPFGMQPVVSY